DATGNRLPEGISRALEESKKLVVLCSPASRERPWVNEEVQQFKQQKGADHILPILLAGCPNEEAELRGVPGEAAFPPAVTAALGPQPWAPDFRSVSRTGARVTTDRAAWFHLLASLYGTSRQVVEQREKMRRLMRGAIAAISALAIVSAVYAFS